MGGGSSISPTGTLSWSISGNSGWTDTTTLSSSASSAAPTFAGYAPGSYTIGVSYSGDQYNTAATGSGTLKVDTPLTIAPAYGSVGTLVTITGTNFGSTQGGSTVSFNGTSATPSSWSATSITVPVPSGATTGPITVTYGGEPQTSIVFTVIPANTSLLYFYSVPPSPTGIPADGGYDAVGNVKQSIDSVMGTWNYTYDTMNRLASGSQVYAPPGGASYPGYNLCMQYDPWGNRTESSLQTSACLGSNPATAKYNASNRVTFTTVNSATTGFTYDAMGDVVYDGVNWYAYDSDGRLCAMQTSATAGGNAYVYIYDAEGRRVGKGTIAGTSGLSATTLLNASVCNVATNASYAPYEAYLLDQDGAELTTINPTAPANRQWQRTNVYGEGKLLATYDVTTGMNFQFADPLGTRRTEVSAAGAKALQVVGSYQSLPFGDYLVVTGEDATPLHYTDKQRDAESGNDYFGARYYASSMGRFMSPDWSRTPTAVPFATLTDPQSLNLYEYVLNNPLTHFDPDGHDCNDGSTQCWLEQHAPKVAAALSDAESSWSGTVGKLNKAAGHLTGRGEFTFKDPSDRAALVNTIGNGVNNALAVIVPAIASDGLSLEAEEGGIAAESWGNENTLERHFADHGADFGATSSADYAQQASDFLQRSQSEGLPTKIDQNGIIRTYDKGTNTFGAYNPDGTTRTYFKPTSPTYFDRQPGKLIQ